MVIRLLQLTAHKLVHRTIPTQTIQNNALFPHKRYKFFWNIEIENLLQAKLRQIII